MQSSGHRLREVEHHPLLAENDCYDSSSSECDAGDRLWFIRDSCGMVCAVMTWLLVVYADFVVTFVMLLPSKDFWYSLVNGVLFNGLAVLALSSHLRTMLTDPGAVPKGNATKEYMESLQLKPGEVIYKCPKCCSVKPERAHHCSICKRCIRKMDHHCPWVNNCVGERNQRFFVLFTMYIALISAHALILCGFQFFSCVRDQWIAYLQSWSKFWKMGRKRRNSKVVRLSGRRLPFGTLDTQRLRSLKIENRLLSLPTTESWEISTFISPSCRRLLGAFPKEHFVECSRDIFQPARCLGGVLFFKIIAFLNYAWERSLGNASIVP